MHHYSLIIPVFSIYFFSKIFQVSTSDIALDIGSNAASQLLREATHAVLKSPKPLHLTISTHEQPLLASLGKIKTKNRISFSNLSVNFSSNIAYLEAANFKLYSISGITPNIWPMSFGDEIVHFDIQGTAFDVVKHAEPRKLAQIAVGALKVSAKFGNDNSINMHACKSQNVNVNASSQNYWIVKMILVLLSKPIENNLEYFLCRIISDTISSKRLDLVKKFSITRLLPLRFHHVLQNSVDPHVIMRIRSMQITEKHLRIITQVHWDHLSPQDDETMVLIPNTTELDMSLSNTDESLTVWIDETVLNEMFKQIDWSFQWMEEKIAVSSPAIPASSREFLSTLCSTCYFLLDVWARGPPVIKATNGSILLENKFISNGVEKIGLIYFRRDRINLRVVNPDKNVTSVFVSMQLTVNAELRPVIDNGIVRTLVQLLDTVVIMENGAFPPSWSLFVQDLVRGMIIDMMWPELKKQFEELTYGQGIEIPASCGIDPQNTEILVDESKLGFSAALNLDRLESQNCISDIKKALPKTSKLFPTT